MSPLSSLVPLPEADVSRELPEVGTAPNVIDAIRCPLRSDALLIADCFTQLVEVLSYLNRSPRAALVTSVVPSKSLAVMLAAASLNSNSWPDTGLVGKVVPVV